MQLNLCGITHQPVVSCWLRLLQPFLKLWHLKHGGPSKEGGFLSVIVRMSLMSSHFPTIIVDGMFPYLKELCVTLGQRRQMNVEQICSYKKRNTGNTVLCVKCWLTDIYTAFLIWYIPLHLRVEQINLMRMVACGLLADMQAMRCLMCSESLSVC